MAQPAPTPEGGRACQKADWRTHKQLCVDKVESDGERPLFVVLENRGVGKLSGFFDLRRAEAHALRTKGDVRRPCDSEKAEAGIANTAALLKALIGGGGGGGGRGLNIAMDHVCYQRPTSATADFIVRGRPSSAFAVFTASTGCTMFIAAVFAGADAKARAKAEAATRNKEMGTPPKGVDCNGDAFGDEWYVARFTVE